MRRVVICSPFRGDRERNHRYLLACLRDAYARGEAPFAPHAIGPLVLDDDDPVQRQQGIAGGLAWLEVADLLAAYVDHPGISDGMREEIWHARRRGIQVEFRTIEGWGEEQAA